jgi:hypothetical protein
MLEAYLNGAEKWLISQVFPVCFTIQIQETWPPFDREGFRNRRQQSNWMNRVLQVLLQECCPWRKKYFWYKPLKE